MKKALFSLLVLGLLMGTASVSFGAGVLGGTDLLVTPATATLNPGNMSLAINLAEDNLTFLNFDFGLASDVEAGIAAYNYYDETKVTLRGKFRLLKETNQQPALAIGIQDIGEDEVSPYLVISKTFTETGFQGYLGAGGGSFDGLFAGITKAFKVAGSKNASQLKQIQLILEADSHVMNAGVKFMLPAASLNFGLTDMDHWILGATINLQ